MNRSTLYITLCIFGTEGLFCRICAIEEGINASDISQKCLLLKAHPVRGQNRQSVCFRHKHYTCCKKAAISVTGSTKWRPEILKSVALYVEEMHCKVRYGHCLFFGQFFIILANLRVFLRRMIKCFCDLQFMHLAFFRHMRLESVFLRYKVPEGQRGLFLTMHHKYFRLTFEAGEPFK
jgi:hypothetical protein